MGGYKLPSERTDEDWAEILARRAEAEKKRRGWRYARKFGPVAVPDPKPGRGSISPAMTPNRSPK